MSVGIELRRLRVDDAVDRFKSNNHRLDHFLKKHAKRNDAAGCSVTWLAMDGTTVVGFVTFMSHSVRAEALTGLLPTPPPPSAPALLLARMATHRSHEGKGVGSRMMRVVYEAACVQADHVGCVGVLVDAKPGAVSFYARKRFSVVQEPADAESATVMFLPLADVRSELAARTE